MSDNKYFNKRIYFFFLFTTCYAMYSEHCICWQRREVWEIYSFSSTFKQTVSHNHDQERKQKYLANLY